MSKWVTNGGPLIKTMSWSRTRLFKNLRNCLCRGQTNRARRNPRGKRKGPRAPVSSHPQIRLPDPVIRQKLRAGSRQGDLPVLQHIGAVGKAQRHGDVLLHQYAGEAVAVELADGPE